MEQNRYSRLAKAAIHRPWLGASLRKWRSRGTRVPSQASTLSQKTDEFPRSYAVNQPAKSSFCGSIPTPKHTFLAPSASLAMQRTPQLLTWAPEVECVLKIL